MDSPTLFFIQVLFSTACFTLLSSYLTVRRTYKYRPGDLFYTFYVFIALWAWFNLLASLRFLIDYCMYLAKMAPIFGEIGILLFMLFLADVSPSKIARYIIPIEITLLGFMIYSNIIADFYIISSNDLFVYFPPSYTTMGALIFFIYLILALILINIILWSMYKDATKLESKWAVTLFILGFNIAYLGTIIGIILTISGVPLTVFVFVGLGAAIIVGGYYIQPTIVYLVPNSVLAISAIDFESGNEIWSYSKLELETTLTSGLITALIKFINTTLRIESKTLIFDIRHNLVLMIYKDNGYAGMLIARNRSQLLISKLRAFIQDISQLCEEKFSGGIILLDEDTRKNLENIFMKHWADIIY